MLGLIDEDFIINTDARSVLSSCDWKNLLLDGFEAFRQSKTSFSVALGNSFFEKPIQSNNRTAELLEILKIARNKTDSQLKYHKITPEDLLSDEFQNNISFITVDSLNREVEHWSQPIYKSTEIESHVLISRVVDNAAEFLIRLSKEPGLLRKVEFGPSISGLKKDSKIDKAFTNINFQKLISVVQSDEGGRFFRNISEYEIRLIDSTSTGLLSRQMEDSSSAYWVSAKTLNLLLREPEVANNELRSVSSLLLKWL
jgi:oxidase EvaA